MQTKGGEDLGISDIIAGFIQQELDQAGGALELQRSDLAQRFNCVPSQINYVMSTRFSPEHGYIVESRRGGGGYIRITRVQVDRQTLLMHVINSVGSRLDAASARAMVCRARSGVLFSRLRWASTNCRVPAEAIRCASAAAASLDKWPRFPRMRCLR